MSVKNINTWFQEREAKTSPVFGDKMAILDSEDANNVKTLGSPVRGVVGNMAGANFEGNARGALAFDFQLSRSAVDQVASGANSFIAGGKNNKASGSNSFVSGEGNVASGGYSVAMGKNNTASKTNNVAIGNNNTASVQYAIAMGDGNTASARGAVAIGFQNTASGEESLAGGNNNNAVGGYSVVFGAFNTGNADGSFVSGEYATEGGGASGNKQPTDHIVKIGNGSGDQSRSDAYRLLRNGTPIYPTMPTSDPAIAGALWNNAGVVNVSAG